MSMLVAPGRADDPSPEEIAERCWAIRLGWSEDQWRVRTIGATEFEVQFVREADLGGEE